MQRDLATYIMRHPFNSTLHPTEPRRVISPEAVDERGEAGLTRSRACNEMTVGFRLATRADGVRCRERILWEARSKSPRHDSTIHYGPTYAGIQKQGEDGEAGGFRPKRVREAGARISKAPFAFPGGRRFHLQDPSGNDLAAWSEK